MSTQGAGLELAPGAALWETPPRLQHTQKLICVFNAPLTDKDTHTHAQKDSLQHMHIETTVKERGGGQWSKKRERARERAAGERVQDKESERRASRTKEKSVTHRERGEQGKKTEKPKSAKKKKRPEEEKKLPRNGRSEMGQQPRGVRYRAKRERGGGGGGERQGSG